MQKRIRIAALVLVAAASVLGCQAQADQTADPVQKKALEQQADAAEDAGEAKHDAIEKQIDKTH